MAGSGDMVTDGTGRSLMRRFCGEACGSRAKRPVFTAFGRFLGWSAWLYLMLVLVLWLTLRTTGDRWWVATILMFGPRWPVALPLLVVLPASFVRRIGRSVAVVAGAVV